MSFGNFDIESEVRTIVVDAVASTADIDREHVVPTMPLIDLDSLDRQEILMEIEQQCDDLPLLEKHDLHIQLPDKKIQKAKTIADLIAVTLFAFETLLPSASGDTQA